jgi:hypothetical protein
MMQSDFETTAGEVKDTGACSPSRDEYLDTSGDGSSAPAPPAPKRPPSALPPASPAAETDTTVDLGAVQIRVRPDEVVITIRTGALAHAPRVHIAPPPMPFGVGGPVAFTTEVSSDFVGQHAGPQAVDSVEASASLGLATVPADKYKNGFGALQIRSDLKDYYLGAYNKVKALGGILTSSGSLRALNAQVTSGRSRTSLHYTGRAFDLFVYTGMQGPQDRYLVARDGGTDAAPEWKLYCTSVVPSTADPDYDESLIQTGTLEYAMWRKNTGYATAQRTETYFCLSDVLASFGWMRIPSRPLWKTDYMSVEWWHFQHHEGLVEGVSTLGEELFKIWPASAVKASGLALNAVWRGRGFAL